jgi:hypothetical protein
MKLNSTVSYGWEEANNSTSYDNLVAYSFEESNVASTLVAETQKIVDLSKSPMKLRVPKSKTNLGGIEVRNNDRQNARAAEFRRGLERCLDTDVVEAGINSSADYFVSSWLKIDPVMVQMEFARIAADSQDNSKRLVGLLNIITHADREVFRPINELFALSCLSLSWVDVKEYAIGVYEYWEDAELIVKQLKNRELTPAWLEEYRKKLVAEYDKE